MADRQPLAHDQPQPEERRQLRPLEVAVQAGRGVEERVLEHVGGVDPALEPCIHAQLDHPAQAVAVTLEQVRQRLAVAAAKPLQEWTESLGSFAIIVPIPLLPARRHTFGTRWASIWIRGNATQPCLRNATQQAAIGDLATAERRCDQGGRNEFPSSGAIEETATGSNTR